MLGLYHYTRIIGHKSCNVLSILNAKYSDKKCVLGKKVEAQQQVKHKTPFRSRVLKSGPLAPKADALPLHH